MRVKNMIGYLFPDRLYLQILWYKNFHKKLNLRNPQTFNEKLQWLKLYDRKPEYTQMVDKYEVRKYIAETIGEQYLIPLLGVWDTFDEIDFDQLPNQFVLKCTHDSGGLVICKDKSKLDIHAAKQKIEKSLKRNYFYAGREWPYKNVKPRIIAEKYMVDESEYELKDYKMFCFSGQPQLFYIVSGKESFDGGGLYLYDLKLQPIPVNYHYAKGNLTDKDFIPNRDIPIEEMSILAQKLSTEIPFVRVDFYNIHDSIYFGEITFYPFSGFQSFTPEEFDKLLGSCIMLPEKSGGGGIANY